MKKKKDSEISIEDRMLLQKNLITSPDKNP